MAISESHARIQRRAGAVKIVAELLSGVVALIVLVRARAHHGGVEIATACALVIALLAVVELATRRHGLRRIKAVTEVVIGLVAIVLTTRAVLEGDEFNPVYALLSILGAAAAFELFAHRRHPSA